MAGFSLRDSLAFDEWQFFQTESLRQELGSALERLVCGHTAQGQYETAIPFARRWLALDPLHEPVHRTLMQLYVWSDQRAAALRQYDECERVLEEELGVPPEEETTQLSQAIRAKQEPPPPDKCLVTPSGLSVLNNRYRLDAELGHGATGVVYRAHDTLLGRDVAVKLYVPLKPGLEGQANLLDEAQAVAQLNHPNIVGLYDVGEAGGQRFIVTELAEGETLHTCPPDTLEGVLDVAKQVCAALDHAHGQGIVHRDLKPEHVIVDSAGRAKLTDFGMARPVATRITSEGLIVGTVFYLAPELALGRRFDGRADLYALGVMLYELTTGELPFTARDQMAVISQHLHAPVVPPRARRADIPPGLEALIVRLLSKDPLDRPASAAEVSEMLEAPDLLNRDAAPAEELSVLKRIERSHLVGREQQLAEARSLWSRAMGGQGQVLLVGGEAGIGKTRLARELVTQVQVLGGRAYVGACYAESGAPYAPFSQILVRALEPGSEGGLEVPDFVVADLLTLAPTLRLDYPDIQPEPPLDDPQAERQRLFENMTICIAALSSWAPLLLILEDVHWADSGTLHLLRHLARHTRHRRVMIVVTHREVGPDQAQVLHETILDLNRERLAMRLKLPRLDREQTELMLTLLFAEEITPEFLDGIYRETEGNPFFIEEVCRALVDGGKLYYEDGRWHRPPSMAELGIPQTVRVAIQARVGVLPAEPQHTLRLAAVLGREFDFETLALASDAAQNSGQGQGEETLLDALERAERAQLIESLSAEGGGTFAFVHALIPTTLVESLRTVERRRLHRAAAAALEARRPDDYEALARHYQQAGEEESAADYLLRAGDRARALYAHQEAIAHYRQALDLLEKAGDLEQVARTQMKLGLTYHNAFDFQASRQAYQEGFVSWQRLSESRPRTPDQLPEAPHALRVSLFEPGSIGLGVSMELPSHIALDQLFCGLVELSPEMGVLPDLAESWEVLGGGRKYVFRIRDDVRWSDGVPVTAGDFEYTWKRLLDPASKLQWRIFLYDIKGAYAYRNGKVLDPESVGVRALDDRTLTVELEGPTSYFPNLLAFVAGKPMPRHVVEEHGDAWLELENIVTNGPFRVEWWERGESLVLERNPGYHGQVAGNLSRVECVFHPGRPAASLQAYEGSRIDVCGDLPVAEFARARQRFADEYVSGPWLSTDLVAFDLTRPPFDDVRVRRAFALATDRGALADVGLRGYAFPATGGLVPPGMPGHSPGIAPPCDPDGARRLLAEAGYPGGCGFPATRSLVRDDPGHLLAAEYLQAQWLENLGVEIAWEPKEWGSFYHLFSERAPHMWLVGWYLDYPDPDDILRVQWWLPLIGWQNEDYRGLVEGARRVLDQAERMEMYQQADRILMDEVPLLPLCYGRFHMLVKPWVKNLVTSPMKWWSWKDVVLEPH
jgi:ABC-type transport system substrate-binding protein